MIIERTFIFITEIKHLFRRLFRKNSIGGAATNAETMLLIDMIAPNGNSNGTHVIRGKIPYRKRSKSLDDPTIVLSYTLNATNVGDETDNSTLIREQKKCTKRCPLPRTISL